MSYKSATQPFCRCCGKAIKKFTRTVYLVDRELHESDAETHYSRTLRAQAKSLADVKRLTNFAVASIRRHHSRPELISSFTEWDGESYVDKFFCNGSYAKEFAYSVAAAFPDIQTKAYAAALEAK